MNTENQKWIRISQIHTRYGLKRTFLYSKIKSGCIESRLVSTRIRLVSIQSIEEFINSSK